MPRILAKKWWCDAPLRALIRRVFDDDDPSSVSILRHPSSSSHKNANFTFFRMVVGPFQQNSKHVTAKREEGEKKVDFVSRGSRRGHCPLLR